MSIAENLQKINNSLHPGVQLIAVTKTHPVERLQELYDAGHRVFGENKVQELCDKQVLLPKDIQWHLIGHLQTNKVKYIAPFIQLIHSVDSIKLLAEIDKQAERNQRVIDCLLQIYLAKEETKFGLSEEELYDLLGSDKLKSFSHIRIVGLMGMASNTEDRDQIRSEFRHLKRLFEHCKLNFPEKADWKEISMGMSSDYSIAMEEGSTMVRVGSSLFGQRKYSQ